MLPLCVLLIAALVLFYRYRYRLLRDRANAVLSRDRAQVDLQMMVHQVQKVQTTSRNSDGSLASSSKSRLPSLPPGPPSSAASESTAPPRTCKEEADRQQYAEVAAPRAALPTADEQEVTRTVAADSGVAPTAPTPSAPRANAVACASAVDVQRAALQHAGASSAPPSAPLKKVPPKRAAPPPKSASAPSGKTMFTSPYHEFCQEQRPLLMPLGMRNRDREKLLGVLAP